MPYHKDLVPLARKLRKNPTEPEKKLWFACLRQLKQLKGVKVYRQRPMLDYIVDFELRNAKLVVEIDGDSHFLDKTSQAKDMQRDAALAEYGYKVVRFTNEQVMKEAEWVCEVIYRLIAERLGL
ncbi:endonuclease domain-containing protein [Oceanithermus profundus]